MSSYNIEIKDNSAIAAGCITGNVYYAGNKISKKPRNVPRNVNSLYTGREDIAAELHKAFHTDEEPSNASPRCFVITGLGGTGKSEVCIKYAIDHWEEYWGIFWVDCSTDDRALESLQEIGNICGISEPNIYSVKNYVSGISESWLWILDNADDTTKDYGVYIPTAKSGHIIITSREPDLSQTYSNVGHHELDQLPPDAAENLLIKAAKLEQPVSDKTRKSAAEIIEVLGRHTLAIVHAGSYIKQYCQIEDYLSHFTERRDSLFKFNKRQEPSHYGTVHATFETSVEKLAGLRLNGETSAEDALELLDMLAFFHYEGYLEDILVSASTMASSILTQEDFPESLSMCSRYHATLLPSWTPSEGADIGHSVRWKACLQHLTACSFISIRRMQESLKFTMHPLVHTWLRERLDSDSSRQMWACLKTSNALTLALQNLHPVPKIEIMETHVRACFPTLLRLQLPIPTYAQITILRQFVVLQSHACTGDDASPGLDKIVSMLSTNAAQSMKGLNRKPKKSHKVRGIRSSVEPKPVLSRDQMEQDRLRTNLKYMKALVLRNSRDYDGSLRLMKEVVSEAKLLYEWDNGLLLMYQSVLAESLHNVGDVKQAIDLQEYVIDVQGKSLDADDHEKLLAEYRVVQSYYLDGQIKRAIELLEHVVDVEKDLDERDRSRLASQRLLAELYIKNGQNEEAIEMLEFIVPIQSRVFAANHQLRLAAEHNLGLVYLQDGRAEQGTKMLEHTNYVYGQIFDEQHLARLNSEIVLAKAYIDVEKFEQSIELLFHIIETRVEESEKTTKLKSDANYLLSMANEKKMGTEAQS